MHAQEIMYAYAALQSPTPVLFTAAVFGAYVLFKQLSKASTKQAQVVDTYVAHAHHARSPILQNHAEVLTSARAESGEYKRVTDMLHHTSHN